MENLSIDDPNLKMEFKGLIDASKEANQLDFEADVEYAELNQLNLIKRDSISVFTGKVVVDMEGKTIDDVVEQFISTKLFIKTNVIIIILMISILPLLLKETCEPLK